MTIRNGVAWRKVANTFSDGLKPKKNLEVKA